MRGACLPTKRLCRSFFRNENQDNAGARLRNTLMLRATQTGGLAHGLAEQVEGGLKFFARVLFALAGCDFDSAAVQLPRILRAT